MRSRGKRRIRPDTRDLRPRPPPHPESSVELATFNRIHDDKIAELEAAVRDLWVIEQKNKKTSSWKPTLAQKTRKDGHPALEQFLRLLVWRSRAGGSKQMGRPQKEDTSVRGVRANL
jgi:hypothetical protein